MIDWALRSIRRFWKNETGAGTVDGLFWTLSSLAIASFAIDGSHAWRSQTQLQTAADASALAAAAYLSAGSNAALEIALKVGDMNLPTNGDMPIIRQDDVTFGVYTAGVGFVSSSDAQEINAVQVDARRMTSRGTQLRTLLMGIIGRDGWDMSARAVAVHRSGHAIAIPDCQDGLLASHAGVVLEGSDQITDGICVHGEFRLITGSGSLYDASITLSSASNDTMIIGGFGPSGLTQDQITAERSLPNTALAEAKVLYQALSAEFLEDAQSYTIAQPEWVEKFGVPIFDENATISVISSTGTWVVDETFLSPNSIYAHRGDVIIPQGTDLAKIAILASGSISHGADVLTDTPDGQSSLDDEIATTGGIKDDTTPTSTTAWISYDHTLLLGRTMTLTGDTRVGTQSTCAGGHYSGYFLSAGDFALGSANASVPVQGLLAFSIGGEMKTEGGMFGAGVYMESEGYQQHYDGTDLTACDSPLTSIFSAPLVSNQKVRASRLVF